MSGPGLYAAGDVPAASMAAAVAVAASALAMAQAVRVRAGRRWRRARILAAQPGVGAGAGASSDRGAFDSLARRLGGSVPARLFSGSSASGSPGRPDDRDRGLALLAAAGLALVGAALALTTPVGLVSIPLLLFVGARFPAMRAARRDRMRRRDLEEQAPELVELLLATTKAGAGIGSALDRAATLMVGALGEELARAAGKVELGEPWSLAVEDLARRTDSPSLRRLAATLGRSGRLGTPVAGALKGLADDLRSVRRARAEESARRAPVKMLFPLVFLILPAFLLLTVGPVFLATIRSLR